MKNREFDELIGQMGKCQRCLNMYKREKNCSLINIYEQNDMSKNIPSIWTDWYNRLDADIMVIGQDWGPYEEMKRLNKQYLENKNSETWFNLMECEKSLTKRMLTRYLKESAELNGLEIDPDYINRIYITNAIMCARNGNNYRGDNIKLRECTLNCSEYLKRQIEIVKPKVIVTLGYYPLLSLAHIYDFSLPKTLKDAILEHSLIEIDNCFIIPLYHPSAQISKEKQLEQYKKIWQYVK
ncbi:MAG: uracil-DNA glycosylase family protein [Bacilli bacterium]|nr:uracil-DNA glycosylase family protein [Bacilli bacterium]